MNKDEGFQFNDVNIQRGAELDVRIKISETYSGDTIAMPVRVICAKEPGPTVFITAAIHGDEINGTGAIHDLLFGKKIKIICGNLILVPIVNVFGYESHDRYLPDRRDLNRCFPGNKGGSLASRIAAILMEKVVAHSDFGIDLHTAAFSRTNYPNVRGDLSLAGVRRIAKAFGCSLIVDSKGPDGSFRRECCRLGCPTICVEAGETLKIEPTILQIMVRGIHNSLIELGLLNGKIENPPFQTRIKKMSWVRATTGGILKFHVSPGDFVDEGQTIATNYSVFGEEQNTVESESDGIVLGMTTMPTVKPGEPICHIAQPLTKIHTLKKRLEMSTKKSLEKQIKTDLATNMDIIDA